MAGQINVPVVIVGGGACGLSLSAFLSDYNVKHVLFERHESTSVLPKAHYLNQRTMETFRSHNMQDPIMKISTPHKNMEQLIWQTSLGGTGPFDRRVYATYHGFGAKADTEQGMMYRRDGPVLPQNLPQIRLEPVLLKIAQERNPGNVRFGHTVLEVTNESDSVVVKVQDKKGQESTYRTQYVIAADGGRSIGSKHGIVFEGQERLGDVLSFHIKADLSRYWDERSLFANYISAEVGAEGEGEGLAISGVLQPQGPTWGRFSEEWGFHFPVRVGEFEGRGEEVFLPKIRQLLNIPDLKLEILGISRWTLESVLANQYRAGRILFAGDAAHRHPPYAGLGLNSAVEDALNLAWKISKVVKGHAGPGLLDTYESERRPIAARNCSWSTLSYLNTKTINAAIGFTNGQVEQNRARLQAIFDGSPLSHSLRALISEVIATQKVEFAAHDLEIGFKYPAGNIIDDGTEEQEPDPLGQIYRPTTKPGNRLPHAWLDLDGRVYSTHDLIGLDDDFVLITDEYGEEWVKAAAEISARLCIRIQSATIRRDVHTLMEPGIYVDRDEVWANLGQLKHGGAVLVRPDNFVAWRSKTIGPKSSLEDAIRTLLYLDQVSILSINSNKAI